jgi:hypothetical protein
MEEEPSNGIEKIPDKSVMIANYSNLRPPDYEAGGLLTTIPLYCNIS